MEYNFTEIDKKWQQYWAKKKTFKTDHHSDKPACYVMDMFPYPSGSGLHVGHPLGYIASDIYARYKRLKGFNVLHPMGYDAFGLPAEQYALQTGQHPAITTEENIQTYRRQLDQIGFSFDWDREVRTSDPAFYKWTQWIFVQLYNHWYNREADKAEPIESLIQQFEKEGCASVKAVCEMLPKPFTAAEWKAMTEEEQQTLLLNYRLAYLSETLVNWCPELGTVLSNEEVQDGRSERGGYPVIRKRMKQWSLRITAYAERLLNGLDKVNWPDSLKEMQRNWIGRSEGAMVQFKVRNSDLEIPVFTTRPDTIYGVTFMVLAPEHELVAELTTPDQQEEIDAYVKWTNSRSERDRQAEIKIVTGAFTGSYVEHPFSGEKIPIWIGDYVLAGYGTGAVMAVPSGDQRDWHFASHFGLPIIPVIEGSDVSEEANESKDGILINSGILNGLSVKEAIQKAISEIEARGLGERWINYRIRDAIFSRQRYWGEPFPVYYKGEIPYLLDQDQLPLELPEVDKFQPTETGDPPLARAENWKTEDGYHLEYSTMPGWAGSSWYYLRYMDPHNDKELVSKDALDYWGNVDLYIGGAEHATGHLLYVRFWTMFLNDLGIVPFQEPAKRLINQGMIQGRSSITYRLDGAELYISSGIYDKIINDEMTWEEFDQMAIDQLGKEYHLLELKNLKERHITKRHVDVRMVNDDVMDIERYKTTLLQNRTHYFLKEDGVFYCGFDIEKMSKRWGNVVTPDEVVESYGADALRLHEMFLGPVEQSKPWNTKGIDGVMKFLRRYWKLYFNTEGEFCLSDEEPTRDEWKTLHTLIKKVEEDNERFSFNTTVSAFMVCVNELTDLKCGKRAILEVLPVLTAPHAPHISEELWSLLGNTESITYAQFPELKEEYLAEDTVTYPVSFNGKMRFKIELPADLDANLVQEEVLSHSDAQKWLGGKDPKKVIVVPKRIVNVVV